MISILPADADVQERAARESRKQLARDRCTHEPKHAALFCDACDKAHPACLLRQSAPNSIFLFCVNGCRK